MAALSTILSSSFLLQGRNLVDKAQNPEAFLRPKSLFHWHRSEETSFLSESKQPNPLLVEFPKAEPQFRAPFLGFTKTAEVWNSRACMIGIIGVFIVELILNKGILQVIGVDVGKGLDFPL